MARSRQQIALAAVLAQATGIHHGNRVAGLGHHAQVMGNHNQRQPALIPQIEQQAQNLRLYRHVEGGSRLIGDQHLGLAAQGHRNHRPLAHATGKLVGIVVDAALGIGNSHLTQYLDSLHASLTACALLVLTDTFSDLLADAHQRVEVTAGILEYHADLSSAHPAHAGLVQRQQVLPGQPHGGTLDTQSGRRQQAHQRSTGQSLARTAFTHQAEDLALRQIEGQAIDQGQWGWAVVGQYTQVLDLQHRRTHVRAPMASATPSASRLKPMARVTMAIPGKVQIHQALVIRLCPSATMVPHSAVGGWTPSPR